MPYRNKDKILDENSVYHAYNRGHNKRKIFKDIHDYNTFIYLLRKYLEPGFKIRKIKMVAGVQFVEFLEPNHLYNEVSVFAYCLMPNHFHLIVQQESKYGMSKLLSRVVAGYSKYYCRKYGLVGTAWFGTYKAVSIQNQKHLSTEISYVHANPTDIYKNPYQYKYSSLKVYIKESRKDLKWLRLHPDYNLEAFDEYLRKKGYPFE